MEMYQLKLQFNMLNFKSIDFFRWEDKNLLATRVNIFSFSHNIYDFNKKYINYIF